MKSIWEETVYRDGQISHRRFSRESKPDYGQEKDAVDLYPELTRQTFEGFGCSATEAPAWLFDRMSEERKKEFLDACWGKEGLGYNQLRLSMDSCDAALGTYSAMGDRKPENPEQAPFSLERVDRYITPFIQSIQKRMGEKAHIMLSPWSPPAFMKNNGERAHGGKLLDEYRSLWAGYYCRYIRELAKRGIEIESISVQNEPAAVQTWDSCLYSAEEEKEFIRDYLHPALEKEGLGDIEIYIWDHNKERALERVRGTVDSDTEELISGVSVHWYSGDHFENLRLIHEQYPHLKLRFSEGCVEYSNSDAGAELENARRFGHDIAGDLNEGVSSYIVWSPVFDMDGNPNWVNNLCGALILYDPEKDELHRTLAYEYVRHFSSYIVPGSRRIAFSRFSDSMDVTAFERPDGELAVVLMNRTDRPKNVYLRINGEVILVPVEGDSMISGKIRR